MDFSVGLELLIKPEKMKKVLFPYILKGTTRTGHMLPQDSLGSERFTTSHS